MVILGHWLAAAPYVLDGELTLSSMLEHQRWTHLLSWIFQVMPVFFMVGGYSNGLSWKAAMRDKKSYAEWLNGRLQRLAGPVLPLLVAWVILGIGAHFAGARPETVKLGSQVAVLEYGAGPLQLLHGRVYGIAHAGLQVGAEVFRGYAYLQSLEGRIQGRRVVLRLAFHGGGIQRVETGHGAKKQGRVLGAARHGSALVQAGGEGDHAVAGDAAVGGLEAGDAAQAGGLAYGAAGVGT